MSWSLWLDFIIAQLIVVNKNVFICAILRWDLARSVKYTLLETRWAHRNACNNFVPLLHWITCCQETKTKISVSKIIFKWLEIRFGNRTTRRHGEIAVSESPCERVIHWLLLQRHKNFTHGHILCGLSVLVFFKKTVSVVCFQSLSTQNSGVRGTCGGAWYVFIVIRKRCDDPVSIGGLSVSCPEPPAHHSTTPNWNTDIPRNANMTCARRRSHMTN